MTATITDPMLLRARALFARTQRDSESAQYIESEKTRVRRETEDALVRELDRRLGIAVDRELVTSECIDTSTARIRVEIDGIAFTVHKVRSGFVDRFQLDVLVPCVRCKGETYCTIDAFGDDALVDLQRIVDKKDHAHAWNCLDGEDDETTTALKDGAAAIKKAFAPSPVVGDLAKRPEIIQIASSTYVLEGSVFSGVFALDSDGRVWARDTSEHDDKPWTLLPQLPEYETPKESTPPVSVTLFGKSGGPELNVGSVLDAAEDGAKCRVCDRPIGFGELCSEHAQGNDPFGPER